VLFQGDLVHWFVIAVGLRKLFSSTQSRSANTLFMMFIIHFGIKIP